MTMVGSTGGGLVVKNECEVACSAWRRDRRALGVPDRNAIYIRLDGLGAHPENPLT